MNAKMPKIRQKANTSNVTPQRHPFLMVRHIQLNSVHVLAHHSEYGNPTKTSTGAFRQKTHWKSLID